MVNEKILNPLRPEFARPFAARWAPTVVGVILTIVWGVRMSRGKTSYGISVTLGIYEFGPHSEVVIALCLEPWGCVFSLYGYLITECS